MVVCSSAVERAQASRGTRRLFVADDAADSRPTRRESSRSAVEGRFARQQLIEQHPEGVNVTARVNVQAAHLGLLRAHVRRRADELLEGGEDRLVGQASGPAVALAMPKSMILGTRHPIVVGNQDVGRLDVPVNDALLVRVLDGLADLDEQTPAVRVVRGCSRRSSSVMGMPRTSSITK